MNIYSFLRAIAVTIDNTLIETNLVAPEFQKDNNSYAVGVLQMTNFEQRSGRGILSYKADCVVMFYVNDIENTLTKIINKTNYVNLLNLLITYNEIIAFNIDKIVTYNDNKKAIALHLSLVINNE